MEWFYRLNEEENGPISTDDLKALFKSKTITAETQVRRIDMPGWKPLRQFVKGAATPPPAPAAQSAHGSSLEMERQDLSLSAATPSAAAPTAERSDARCSECGRVFPPDDLIRFDDAHICAACKPLFTQKLREGVRVQKAMVYAGFWIRFGAKFIDMLIVTVVSMIIGFMLGLAIGVGGVESADGSLAATLVIQIFNILIPATYTTFMVGRYGATLGKMACGIKVVRPDGGRVSYARALGRYFAEILSGLILAIGYIMAAFDSEKRALHDHICSTRVVKK